jgi:hypothetical protein
VAAAAEVAAAAAEMVEVAAAAAAAAPQDSVEAFLVSICVQIEECTALYFQCTICGMLLFCTGQDANSIYARLGALWRAMRPARAVRARPCAALIYAHN